MSAKRCEGCGHDEELISDDHGTHWGCWRCDAKANRAWSLELNPPTPAEALLSPEVQELVTACNELCICAGCDPGTDTRAINVVYAKLKPFLGLIAGAT
jgi:hypothetical protein